MCVGACLRIRMHTRMPGLTCTLVEDWGVPVHLAKALEDKGLRIIDISGSPGTQTLGHKCRMTMDRAQVWLLEA